jgi:hypothetical protein
MTSPKTSPSWRDVKPLLAATSQEELLKLVRDLYALRPENKDFVHARFLTSEETLQPFKAIIGASFYPITTLSKSRLARGCKAINDYKKAANDSLSTLELMVHDVECGTQLAGDVGDIAKWYYASVTSMFAQGLQTLRHSDHHTINCFLPRLEAIVNQAEGSGWGYYDNLSEALDEAFPARRYPMA